jgi:DNA-directed RNA polymerase II subunit RPB1
MSLYKELSYEHDVETVRGIQFCIMSPEEIVKRSVAEILSTDTYIGTEPVPNGLFDPRMGVIDNNKICTTCEQKNTFCPNHFGHIVLARPVFYVQFFEYVRKILRCVCWRCSRIMIDLDSPEVLAILSKKHARVKRFELMFKLLNKNKKKVCDGEGGCGAKRADKVIKEKDGILKLSMEWASKEDGDANAVKKQVFSAEDVLRIFKRISDADIELLGFHKKYNRPEYMICTVLPVPPPAVRPSVRNDTGQRMEDDLTHKLCDIVKANIQLKQKIEKGVDREHLEPFINLLQYHVVTMVDNQNTGLGPSVQRTGRPLRSLFERLKSKEGRIRGNLMGKRVDFSARTVITPDPCISIDEIGVPIKIAMNLTFPEIVNKYNIERLTSYVHNGPDVYPGAKYIRKTDPQRTIRLKNLDTTTITLDIGDTVDRHMLNGDYVLFNRQPSLHKMSMQGHRVRVMPYDTFRLNSSVCKST